MRYYCSDCTWEGKTPWHHLHRVHGIGERVYDHRGLVYYLCCGRKWFSQMFINHARRVHGIDVQKRPYFTRERIRCPHCKGWGATKARHGRIYTCVSCGKHFRFKEGALMDGIFLDQYPLLKQRAEAYIREGCKELGKLKDVNEKELYEVAMKIYEKLIENSPEWEGYHPRTTVAGVLYIAGLVQQEGEDGISQREISEVMNVTILFIKKKYIEIANELGFSPVYLQQHQLRAGLAHLKRYITELVRG